MIYVVVIQQLQLQGIGKMVSADNETFLIFSVSYRHVLIIKSTHCLLVYNHYCLAETTLDDSFGRAGVCDFRP